MWLEFSQAGIVVANVVCVPAIHLFVSWLFTRMPRSAFRTRSPLFRPRSWEDGGTIYEALFRVRKWKGLLPDAAPWFAGFAKGKLRDRDPGYLRAFVAETCRGEIAHYVQVPALLLTLAWNPWPVAAIVMVAYAFASNFPCVILQRFTRARLRRLLAELGEEEIP